MYCSVGEDDGEVRAWCKANGALYQPYASARNVKNMKTAAPAAYDVVSRIAKTYSQTNHAVIYKYFLQMGAAIIPRSTNSVHMAENLDTLNWSLSSNEQKQLSETSGAKAAV